LIEKLFFHKLQKIKTMIAVNGNFDLEAYLKINVIVGELNDQLIDLCNVKFYITLVASKEKSRTRVHKSKGDIFLWLVLPFDEIIAAEDPKPIIIDTLMAALPRLKRYKDLIDIEALKREMEERFELEVAV
jgi:hypothetical protein